MYGIHSILIDEPFLAVLSYLSAVDMLKFRCTNKAILGRVNEEHENYLPGNFATITANWIRSLYHRDRMQAVQFEYDHYLGGNLLDFSLPNSRRDYHMNRIFWTYCGCHVSTCYKVAHALATNGYSMEPNNLICALLRAKPRQRFLAHELVNVSQETFHHRAFQTYRMIADYFVKWGSNIFRTLPSAEEEASKAVLYIFENELEYEIVFSIQHRAIICISGRCDSARANWDQLDRAKLFYDESLGQRLAEGERVMSLPSWDPNKFSISLSYNEDIFANPTDLTNFVKQYLRFIRGRRVEMTVTEADNFVTNSDVLCFVACIINHELTRQLDSHMISVRRMALGNSIW